MAKFKVRITLLLYFFISEMKTYKSWTLKSLFFQFFFLSRKYLESRLGGGDTVHYLNHYIVDCIKKQGRWN